MNGKDAERMSLIDDLMLEEIFSDDADDVETGAGEAIRKSLEGAELALRADSDEAAPRFRDDCAPLFRDDVAPPETGPCWLRL